MVSTGDNEPSDEMRDEMQRLISVAKEAREREAQALLVMQPATDPIAQNGHLVGAGTSSGN